MVRPEAGCTAQPSAVAKAVRPSANSIQKRVDGVFNEATGNAKPVREGITQTEISHAFGVASTPEPGMAGGLGHATKVWLRRKRVFPAPPPFLDLGYGLVHRRATTL